MLWLKFKDENGKEQRLEVDREVFTVGRHSGCDLTYSDSRLSREHLRFERYGDGFLASDLGSSNGTTINGIQLGSPAEVRDGDVFDLGGGLEIAVEVTAAEPQGVDETAPGPDRPGANQPIEPGPLPSGAAPAYLPEPPQPAAGGIPTAFFILAPLLGIFVLVVAIGAFMLLGGGGKEVATYEDDLGSTSDIDDEDNVKKPANDDASTPKPGKAPPSFPTDTPVIGGTPSPPVPGGKETPSGGETAKIEQNSAAFLRQIAQNDPRAFLTGEQAAKVDVKVKQVGRSSALADNFNSARKSASAIKSLAAAKNLKPQFLAVAAIIKLGGSRGDVLQAAQSVADVYDKLAIQIGNENFDDALLMIAAYDQGAAGDTMKLRNMLQSIAETPGSPGTREIRSIWYLQKTGKITSGEFDRALNFLAVGTIAQNPRGFGVNAETLVL